MEVKNIGRCVELAIWIIGTGLIVLYAGWFVAIGVFFVIWANNLNRG